jgi:hypothetical protein
MQTIIATLAMVLALLAATPSRANVLDVADVKGFEDFQEKADTLMHDIVGASGPTTINCLMPLALSLQVIKKDIYTVLIPAMLEIAMVSPVDDMQVLTALRFQVPGFLKDLAAQRGFVDGLMGGGCASSGVAAVKAQEVVRLFDQAALLVGPISKKVHAVTLPPGSQ